MAKNKNFLAKYGPWFFLLGVVLALLMGLGQVNAALALPLLVLLGLIVGVTNVSPSEMNLFLLATIVLILSSSAVAPLFATLGNYGALLQSALNYLVTFAASAAFIVSLKALYDLSKD